MRLNSLEKSLKEKLDLAILDVTPGVVVRAYHQGRMICDLSSGVTSPLYDLASLTKVIFTQQAMMQAFDMGLWNLDSLVTDFLPDFNHKNIKITQLLTHTSGLVWWLPLYQEIPTELSWQQKREWLYNKINTSEVKASAKAVYSDIGFMTLGFILEALFKKDLLSVWQQVKNDFYSTTGLDFHVDNKPLEDIEHYAATELCNWRSRVIKGQVHDENTYALGGLSTHAGLFGSIDDVAAAGLNIRSQLHGIARYKVKQKTAQFFAQRATHHDVGDWALGYMLPSAENSSCGPFFSNTSIGHTGFTGTSMWYDIQNDLLILILSNRVNYGRENKRFIHLRPQIHSWIFESIKRAQV